MKSLIKILLLQFCCIFMLFIFGITYSIIVIFELCNISITYALIISLIIQYSFWIYQCYNIYKWNKVITALILFIGIVFLLSLADNIYNIYPIIKTVRFIPFLQPEIDIMLTIIIYINTSSVMLYMILNYIYHSFVSGKKNSDSV
jgi:hypothetical protein